VIECKWSFEDVSTVLDPDAGNHADLAGLFAATHRPVPGERSVAEAPATPLDDASLDAYAALASNSADSWPIIIPVLGEPGTGKSHLVRWVWNQFRRVRNDSFAVVYIPRIRMNIAGVMERLLDAALKDPDESVRQAAEELLTAARVTYQDRDLDRVARELRAETIFQLKRVASRRVENSAQRGDASEVQFENAITALETILSEGAGVERHHHSDASAIGRRVAVLVEGRPEGNVHEAPTGFTVEELQRYVPLAAGQSQEFTVAVRSLIVKQEWGTHETVAGLMNEALDRAVAELIAKGTQSRGLTFTEVFRRLRESLYRADRELVIFVEELKLLGGVERELLESFLDNSSAAGLAPICRVRALIACTTGEWTRLSQDIGTFTSRLNAWRAPRYKLDGGAALSEQQIKTHLLDMAAYYLNAARVGVSKLEEDFHQAGDATAWTLPNACDSCDVRERCHATFGTGGTNGVQFGLFPFNIDALERAQEYVQLQQIDTPLADGFNPRILLTGVLTPTLKNLIGAPDGFPSPALARELNFSPALEATIRQALEMAGENAEHVARAAVLLEGWGDATRSDDGQLTQYRLAPGIAEMFGAAKPPAVSVRPVATEPRPVDRGPSGGTKAPAAGLIEAVDRWRNGTDLISIERRDLRNRLYELLMRHLDWSDFAGVGGRSPELLREAGIPDAEQLIFVEETTPSQPSPREDAFALAFNRNDEDYIFLRAVATVGSGNPGVEELIVLGEGLTRLAASLAWQLEKRGIARSTTLAVDHPGLAALAVTSIAHGLDPGSTDIAAAPQLVAALVAHSSPLPNVSTVSQTRELFEVLSSGVRVPRDDALLRGQERATREDARRWLLRRIGLRRSVWAGEDENVQMLDVASIYDAALNLTSSSRIAPLGTRKPDANRGESAAMAQLATTTAEKIADSLQHEIERSRTVVGQLAEFCGFESKEVTAIALTAAVDAAAAAAESADALVRDEGMLPSGNTRHSYRTAADAFGLVRAQVDAVESGRLLLEVARTSKPQQARTISARLYGSYTPFNNYRQAAEALVTRAAAYLEYMRSYIPQHHQTTSNPILDSFPDDYRDLLKRIRQLLEHPSDATPAEEE
jgi:Cdc6-like AAA superfamily ATPase